MNPSVRRHRLLLGLVAVGVVALVAVPVAALVDDDAPDPTPSGVAPSSTAPAPAPTPTTTARPDGRPDARDIPGGFPLAAGWPDDEMAEPGRRYGLRGPDRRLEPIVFEACDQEPPQVAHTDRVVARWWNVEDYRWRQLTTYPDADRAVADVALLIDHYRTCPVDPGGDGYTTLTRVRATEVGGESWAIVRNSEFDGAPAVGLEVIHVVRLGRAVLVDTASNEGGAGPDLEADIRRHLRDQISSTAAVVSAMCAFTEAGCGG